METIRFSCTRLEGTNKVGLLKADANGYYTVVLGALNAFGSGSNYYVASDEVRALFENSSQFQRRVARGALKAENGHPVREPGMSREAYFQRAMVIRESRICAHIKEVWLDFDSIKDADGKPVIAIMGKVAPSGELGYVLEGFLKNPDENICFSIRAYTDDYQQNGRLERFIRNLVTFDLVNEQGVKVADKYYSPALESFSEESVMLTKHVLERVSHESATSAAMESCSLSMEELFDSFGWKESKNGRSKPVYMTWAED